MPEDVRVHDVDSRNKLVEFLVDKRVKGLEYLRKHHVQEDQLWMGTICIGKSDIFNYFNLDSSLLVLQTQPCGAAPNPLKVGSDKAVVFFERDATQPEKLTHTVVTPPAIEGLQSKASSTWLKENMQKWYLLGVSCANLMMLPLTGVEYVDALYQLLLEIDHFFATGASKMLAGRALKTHKQHARSMSGIDADSSSTPQSPSPSVASGFVYSYLLVDDLPSFQPSYDTVVPPLCSTLVFIYKKMCDFEIIESSDSVKRLMSVDKRLKRLFFGTLSKEIGCIARHKTMQQYQLLQDNIFPTFSHAGDETVGELIKGAQTVDETFNGSFTGPEVVSQTSMPSTSAGVHHDPVGSYFSEDDDF